MKIAQLVLLIFLLTSRLYGIDRFAVITPEKTGTNLLLKAVKLLTGMEYDYDWHRDLHEKLYHAHLYECEKNGTFSFMHIPADEKYIQALKTRKYKVVFMMRDPRDQLMSMYFYIIKGWEYEKLSKKTRFIEMPFDKQIDEMITGKQLGTCVPKVIVGWKLPWMFLEKPEVYTARYENLVGPKGGGSREAQVDELTAIAKFLNIKISKRKILAIADSLYGKPGEATFNTGKIGTWKKYFNEEHKDHFKEVFGDELILLGYENDYEW